MHVIIYGLMRSGTTLVADLLSVPGRSLIISEPDLYAWQPRTVARVCDTMAEWGLIDHDVSLERGDHKMFMPRFMDALVPRLATLDCWGIKQVNFANWRHLMRAFEPGKLILCVRDLRDIVLSSLDLMHRQLLAFPGGRHARDEAWVVARLVHGAHELMTMRDMAHMVVRYEDIVSDPDQRAAVAAHAGVAGLGRERPNLRREPAARAQWERGKHGDAISDRSVGRYNREPAGPTKFLAEWVWRLLPAYSEAFGYETPSARMVPEDHPFCLTRPPGRNPVRFSDTQSWDWPGPDVFDPAFARRRARMAAGGALAGVDHILDFGATCQAVRTLTGAKRNCQLVDVAARSADHVVADFPHGQLPPHDGCDHVTALGALEYVTDLPAFMAALRAYERPLTLSYHATDDTADLDRAVYGWANHWSRAAFQRICEQAGFAGSARWAFDGRQGLVSLRPR